MMLYQAGPGRRRRATLPSLLQQCGSGQGLPAGPSDPRRRRRRVDGLRTRQRGGPLCAAAEAEAGAVADAVAVADSDVAADADAAAAAAAAAAVADRDVAAVANADAAVAVAPAKFDIRVLIRPRDYRGGASGSVRRHDGSSRGGRRGLRRNEGMEERSTILVDFGAETQPARSEETRRSRIASELLT